MLTSPLHSACLAFAATTLVLSVSAHAGTTAIAARGGGWFSDAGEHIEANAYYLLGGGADGYTRNNYFLFDMSGFGAPITSATLRVYNPGSPPAPGAPYGYTSSDPTETYALFDVSTNFYSVPTGGAHLVGGYAIGSAAGQAIYSDLGSGQSYGTYTASLADNGHFVEISLNAAGLAALNASSGIFAIGGSITTLDAIVNRESLFVSGYLGIVPNAVELVVTSVPEPSEAMLLLAGLGVIALSCHRRKGKADDGSMRRG